MFTYCKNQKGTLLLELMFVTLLFFLILYQGAQLHEKLQNRFKKILEERNRILEKQTPLKKPMAKTQWSSIGIP